MLHAPSLAADALTGGILACAFDVHRKVGPGMLESVYQHCLAIELRARGYDVQTEHHVPLVYRGVSVATELKLDFLVNREVAVEIKAVEKLLPVHQAQIITYLKLLGLSRGLLLNFNVPTLKQGIRRVVHPSLYRPPASDEKPKE